MHIIKSRFLRRGEVWFDEEPDQSLVDWIYYRQRSHPVGAAKCHNFHTLLVDLEQRPEELLKSFNTSTRYNIKRARDVDGFTCEAASSITSATLRSFEEIYKPFAAHKGLGSLDCSRLEELAKEGYLDLSSARNAQGTALVHHVYYRNGKRSCLMHSVSLHYAIADSLARNAVARANCLLTYDDMLRHKERGLKHFDFGGWYPGKTDQTRLNINRFKKGFGGNVVCEYNCEQIITFKGRVILAVAAFLERGKALSGKAKSARTNGPEATLKAADGSEAPSHRGSNDNGAGTVRLSQKKAIGCHTIGA